MTRGIHTAPNKGATDCWLTPPEILKALGKFDLDPCAAANQPWRTAKSQWTSRGLTETWWGRVYLNPPYGTQAWRWVEKLAAHGNGIALLACRTETKTWKRFVWGKADSILFLDGRLYFHKPDGTRGPGNAGHGSALVAYGPRNHDVLEASGLRGWLCRYWRTT